ncbi:hypothetical protein DXG03_007694 [Asterophora parasitica]|uniref:Uncharacterized protein n=1 Tax=Asterophora parasitica TaxID=117018 RepID=A0A9P7G0D7_9AGAR|nr:hypothetical protein DXG03_007694 [Asterophora parasitica]
MCRAVINVLKHHFSQCSQIVFDVIRSSSLPSISTDFYGDAPSLCSLRLKCRVDDGVAAGSRKKAVAPAAPFTSSNVYELDIDGRNFAYACLDLQSWRISLSKICHPIRISLSHLTPSRKKDLRFTQWDLSAILSRIPGLTALTLHDVEFGRTDYREGDGDDLSFIRVSQLVLSHMNAISLERVLFAFELFDLKRMEVNRCEFSHAIDSLAPAADEITFKDIVNPVCIAGFLLDWQGTVLNFERCPELDDQDLLELADEPRGHIFFDLKECPNISVAGVRRMVESMNDVALQEALHMGQYAVMSVSASNQNTAPPPSCQDLEWLFDHVEHFSWSGCGQIPMDWSRD